MKQKKTAPSPRKSAVAATALAVGTGDYLPFAEFVEAQRQQHRGKGRRPQWVRSLAAHDKRVLAAATLFAIFESTFVIDSDDENEPPLLLTVAGRLGASLLPRTDRPEQQIAGAQLLYLASRAAVIKPLKDPPYTVRPSLATAKRAMLIAGASAHARSLLLPTPPVGPILVRQHRDMKPRANDVPAAVEAAANKVRRTAWRVNLAVLAELQKPAVRDLFETRDRIKGTKARATIEQAAQAHDCAKFYMDVRLDFRGRMYQRGGLLTYTGGSDIARGLLEFADGEILDEKGQGWLAMHMAQMWGRGTKTLRFPAEAVEWAAACGALDWLQAKEPVQFLAARLAWQGATASKPRPCHLPIRLDASCSGLQHLALLTRDDELARKVNLWGAHHGALRHSGDPFARAIDLEADEDDFYKAVAAAASVDRAQAKAVIVPMLYNASAETCGRALTELRTGKKRPKRARGKEAAAILADDLLAKNIQVFARGLAPEAFKLLAWFGKVAGAHRFPGAQARCLVPLTWTTPSGFVVTQDYRLVDKRPRRSDRQVSIKVGAWRVDLVRRFLTEELDIQQQRTSAPSSFVHSLDASLLVETVNGADIDAWAVAHDAFGVPGSKVATLLDAYEAGLRRMYTPNRVQEWLDQWTQDGVTVPSLPVQVPDALPKSMLGGLRMLG